MNSVLLLALLLSFGFSSSMGVKLRDSYLDGLMPECPLLSTLSLPCTSSHASDLEGIDVFKVTTMQISSKRFLHSFECLLLTFANTEFRDVSKRMLGIVAQQELQFLGR